MKRTIKNIISILFILMVLGGIVFTTSKAWNNTLPSEEIKTEQTMSPPNEPNQNNQNQPKIETKYIIYLIIEDLIFILLLIYLIMSKLNKLSLKETFKNKDKIIIYLLLIILFTPLLTYGIIKITTKNPTDNKELTMPNEENEEKDEVTLDKSNIITTKEIDLSDYDNDITINTKGTYTITGEFNHSLIIEASADDEIELVFNNIKITNENTATIIALSGKSLTINSKENTTNTLTDGGNSEYDGCIYSEIPLIFTGNGTLEVNGNQNEGEGIATETQDITFNNGTYIVTSNDDGLNAGGDGGTITINNGTFYINASGDGIDSNQNAVINGGTIFVIGSDVGGDAGIDTDEGYTINGGTVIALGSDMIETPSESSKQKTLAFTLDQAISSNTVVSLISDDETIISFNAPKSFKTLIISTNSLENKSYTLYTNGTHTGTLTYGIYQGGKYTKGEKLTINNSDTFTITKTINYFGKSNK